MSQLCSDHKITLLCFLSLSFLSKAYLLLHLISPFLFDAEFGCVFFFVVVVLCHRLNYRFEHLIIRNNFFRLFKLTYWQRTLIRTSVNSL